MNSRFLLALLAASVGVSSTALYVRDTRLDGERAEAVATFASATTSKAASQRELDRLMAQPINPIEYGSSPNSREYQTYQYELRAALDSLVEAKWRETVRANAAELKLLTLALEQRGSRRTLYFLISLVLAAVLARLALQAGRHRPGHRSLPVAPEPLIELTGKEDDAK